MYKVITAVCPEGLSTCIYNIYPRELIKKCNWYHPWYWWCYFYGISRKRDDSGSLWPAENGECWWEGTSCTIKTAGVGCQIGCEESNLEEF